MVARGKRIQEGGVGTPGGAPECGARYSVALWVPSSVGPRRLGTHTLSVTYPTFNLFWQIITPPSYELSYRILVP